MTGESYERQIVLIDEAKRYESEGFTKQQAKSGLIRFWREFAKTNPKRWHRHRTVREYDIAEALEIVFE